MSLLRYELCLCVSYVYLQQIFNKQTRNIKKTLRGHTEVVLSVQLVESPNDTLVLSCSRDKTIR